MGQTEVEPIDDIQEWWDDLPVDLSRYNPDAPRRRRPSRLDWLRRIL